MQRFTTKKLTFLTFFLFLLSSCVKTHDTKITLPYKVKGIKAYVLLASEESLTALINDEESNNFILVSYALESCTCWVNFKNDVIHPFVTETEVPLYVIHTDNLSSYYGLQINASKTNTPVFGIYEKGVYFTGQSYTDDESLFTTYRSFYRYVTSYVNLPTNYK